MSAVQELLSRFDFSNPNMSDQVLVAMVAIWVLVLLCAATSIMTRPFRLRTRLFWLAVVVLLPLVGLLLYLPFSLREQQFPYTGFWFKGR